MLFVVFYKFALIMSTGYSKADIWKNENRYSQVLEDTWDYLKTLEDEWQRRLLTDLYLSESPCKDGDSAAFSRRWAGTDYYYDEVS